MWEKRLKLREQRRICRKHVKPQNLASCGRLRLLRRRNLWCWEDIIRETLAHGPKIARGDELSEEGNEGGGRKPWSVNSMWRQNPTYEIEGEITKPLLKGHCGFFLLKIPFSLGRTSHALNFLSWPLWVSAVFYRVV